MNSESSASSSQPSPLDNTEQLIQLYREHPDLWDVTNTFYKDRYIRDESFRDIGAKLKIDPRIVKDRLRKLRTQYNQERRKFKTRKTGSAAEHVRSPKWRWFNALDLLGDTFKHRKTTSTLDEVQIQNLYFY